MEIEMTVKNISAGFVECDFTTNKEAYYYVNATPVREGLDPMTQQKQFMTLELDDANMEYIQWRNILLQNGEFTIAPFASHALQYGDVEYFFTGLDPDTDYWIYAFVVNPDKMVPVGKLYLQRIHTKEESTMDIHFSYRIKGKWSYIYPLDEKGNINSHFPYLTNTIDSLELAEAGQDDPVMYGIDWILYFFLHPQQADVNYGVRAIANDGWSTPLEFKEGHTYYTVISGFDGIYERSTLYKFTWTGEKCRYLFYDTDSANIVNSYDFEGKDFEI
ncbi:MAG: hypothetical protein J5884_05995 [Paludibacteraceae bacterium]|nr:hypothetical protein [Paludibacteraceae bacterium]